MEPRHSAGHDTGSMYYAEDRCALRWPLAVTGLVSSVGGGALAIFCFGYALVAPQGQGGGFIDLGLITAIWSCFWTWLTWSNWATGIRVDQAGIRIGGVRGFERHGPRLGRRPRSVANQRHEVFTCPWAAVSALAVTDRADLDGLFERQPSGHARAPRPGRIAARAGYYQLRGSPRTVDDVVPRRPRTAGFRLGWLPAPFMRTGLVVVIVPDEVRFPVLRPIKGAYGERFVGTPSTVWLAPTRHPQALRAALARVPGGPPVADHIGPDFAAWSG